MFVLGYLAYGTPCVDGGGYWNQWLAVLNISLCLSVTKWWYVKFALGGVSQSCTASTTRGISCLCRADLFRVMSNIWDTHSSRYANRTISQIFWRAYTSCGGCASSRHCCKCNIYLSLLRNGWKYRHIQ